ncbi:Dgcr14-like protein [Plakobranchus ocellatus]|uniref:Dgcr14-like protein n=1 Tax=Plakobranchus ocellatus TaxID=259542 RepID=A0AAV3ZXM7_9GAST|nr:Dgcr14-like protein [Plakobranchus ocellatus]
MEKSKAEKNSAIVPYEFKVPSRVLRKPKKVLSEDDFSEGISKIIERDFFPDIPKLEAKAEYYEALEKNDLVKLREIQMRFQRPDTNSTDAGNSNTPLTFETPEGRRKTTPMTKKRPETDGSQKPETVEELIEQLGEGGSAPKEKLDTFLARNTSEDSASFADILRESELKHRHKHQWLFDKEKEHLAEHKEMLALPSIEEQAMIMDKPTHLNTWKYQNKNTVMYVPQGVELSAKELIEAQKHKPREIVHENTRFHYTPFSNIKHKEAMQKAASFKALINHGKIGHDGKEVQPDQSPKVNGFSFVGTPSPAPGAQGESPMMTWGELDSTPARLDPNSDDTLPSATPGPVFRIPAVPRRDRLALELSEKASKAHRAKKEEALKQVTRRFASPSQASKLGLSSAERLNSMSPAAQRLASKRLGIRTSTDKALQASYTPSPSSSPRLTPRGRTPNRTPTPGSKRSRAASLPGSPATPSSERGSVTPRQQQSPSLTDHLLNLPKRGRKSAADFF